MLRLSTRATDIAQYYLERTARAARGLRRLCLCLAVDRLGSTERCGFHCSELPAAAAELLLNSSC